MKEKEEVEEVEEEREVVEGEKEKEGMEEEQRYIPLIQPGDQRVREFRHNLPG